MSVTYGSFVLMNAVDGMITLGRWDEAPRSPRRPNRSAAATGGSSPTSSWHASTPRGNIEAATPRSIASHKLARPNEAQFSGRSRGHGMELDLLLGDIASARASPTRLGRSSNRPRTG